jgi:hypothetical protein
VIAKERRKELEEWEKWEKRMEEKAKRVAEKKVRD